MVLREPVPTNSYMLLEACWHHQANLHVQGATHADEHPGQWKAATNQKDHAQASMQVTFTVK